MKEWLEVHRTMVAYCRYCTLRAQWALIEKLKQRDAKGNRHVVMLGFFCKEHREEHDQMKRGA